MAEFDYKIVQDPAIFRLNVLPAHSDTVLFQNERELNEGETSLRASLNGLWRFSYAANYASVVKGFESSEIDVSGWDEIHVPANMQMEGYDAPAYVNTQYPWDGREEIEPGQIPERYNPVGAYVTDFEVPKAWEGCGVRISFQGVESGFALWLNGKYIGYSEDSFTPSEFELTPYLREGENRLQLLVFKWTSGSWLEDQDMFRFSGIFRDVYLYAVPKAHIEDLQVTAGLDDSYRNGLLCAKVKLSGKAGKLAWSLTELGTAGRDAAGNLSFEKHVLIDAGELPPGEEKLDGIEASLKLQLENVSPWSAEIPALYALRLTLFDEDGQVVEVLEERVGFRRFEMKDGIMTLNGKRIVFFGVNRHEFSCDTGRAPRPEDVERDIRIMKQNNINAVRTCHYSNASMIYSIADLYGLYLIAETNMETHGMWDRIERGYADISAALPGDRKEYLPMMLDRVHASFYRDRNHPSILIWSVGNESYGGSVIYEMSQEFRRLDPGRLVHYEGVMHDRRYNDSSDMESQMYTPAEGVRAFLEEHPEKPFILCEYAHSMGNSTGALHKYIELSEENPRYQGGFIWDFVDQAVRKKNRYGEEFAAYGGDSYERPTDYDFSGNGIVDSTRRIYAKMQEVKACYSPMKISVERNRVLLENKSLFLSSDAWDWDVTLAKEGRVLQVSPIKVEIPPLSKGEAPLPLQLPESEGEYTITVSSHLRQDTLWGKKGDEVSFGQGVFEQGSALERSLDSKPSGLSAALEMRLMGLSRQSDRPALSGFYQAGRVDGELCGVRIPAAKKAPKLQVDHGAVNIGVRGEHFEVLLSNLKGGIVSYRWGGRELIDDLPRPNFWRAPTSNDYGNRMPARYGQWKIASLYQDFLDPDMNIYQHPFDLENESARYPLIEETEDSVSVSWKKFFGGKNSCLTTYRIFPDGTVRCILSYDGTGKDLPPMPEYGWLFTLNADFDRVSYYGMGPKENYCDRRHGARLGFYTEKTVDMVEPYLLPQETGNRTGVRYAAVTDRKGRGLLFSAAFFPDSGDVEAAKPGTMEFSAIPYSPEMLETAKHPFELPPVHHTFVRCSLKQMGIGGDDSWGAKTHEEYLLKNDRKLVFAVDFRGI